MAAVFALQLVSAILTTINADIGEYIYTRPRKYFNLMRMQ
jgi:hypothetical protein